MWLCLEVDTEDSQIWSEIDRMMCEELGLTHIVWGVDREKDRKPAVCKLPSNLFYGQVSTDERELTKLAMNLLNPLRLSYRIITMDPGWHHQDIKVPGKASIFTDNQEIESRSE